MILADTSVWIDHFRHSDPDLLSCLQDNQVTTHIHVLGELAVGSLQRRGEVLGHLARLPRSPEATHEEVMGLIERKHLFSHGLGYTDVHLIASVLLRPGLRLWTRDVRLRAVASELSISV